MCDSVVLTAGMNTPAQGEAVGGVALVLRELAIILKVWWKAMESLEPKMCVCMSAAG